MPRKTPSPPKKRAQPTLPFGMPGEAIRATCSVARITFSNPQTGYAVVHLAPADQPTAPTFVAVGTFGEPQVGQCYRIEGEWRHDIKFGPQVRVSSAVPEMPRSLEAIERYLAGSSIKGMGPHYAHALVKHFGPQTLDELQAGGGRLEDVPGIGPVRAGMIRESWAEHRGTHDLMVNLQGIAGLSPNQALRIYRRFGSQAWDIVSRNPYSLAEAVRGFGFRTCDRIGRALGIEHDAPQRIQAGVLHLLQTALRDGHLWSPVYDLIARAAALLGVLPNAVTPQIDLLAESGRAIRETFTEEGAAVTALVLPRVAHAEGRAAERLARLLRAPPGAELGLSPTQVDQLLARVPRAEQLTDEQRGAIADLLAGNRLVILTGGPGTGKTTTVRSLIACLEQMRVSYALCATTGRAAKQLAGATDRPAATVHRHLRIGFGGDQGAVEAIRETVLVIDESSMIDLWLLDQISARLAESTHLMLVGDVDQLPPVGPGAVLQDLIAAGSAGLPGIRVTRLTQIFRQEAGEASTIVVNCHRVRAGQRPLKGTPKATDYYEMVRATSAEARDLAVELAAQRLPDFLHLPPHEVQVLAPMHGGEAGIRVLNQALQATLNPPKPGKAELSLVDVARGPERGRVLRVGDKVRQVRNNYRKRVFNGDLGVVTRIDLDDEVVTVGFDDLTVAYSYDELDELVHAWAMTVHAAQGSEWPAVVVIMLKEHYVMLERNILYTALSRAQRLVVLVTQEQAVRIAVAQDRSTRRRTGLVRRLAQALSADV